jgi:selenium-binding protein 1
MAMKGPRETIVYTVMISCGENKLNEPDCLATIDVDPTSASYCQIIHKLQMTHLGDELHHFGWNACSSCCDDSSKSRRFLILTGLKSSRIYIVDTLSDPLAPSIYKTIEPDTVKSANLSVPHTVHCLADGNIMISMLGDRNGDAPGGFLLIDDKFEIVGKYGDQDYQKEVKFGYDFWYQPYHNVMISSEWTAPNTFFNGFNPADVGNAKYGQQLHLWDWKEQKIKKTFNLGSEGLLPLEVRFHHEPKSTHGYVGCALSSSVWHWYKDEASGEWKVEKVIQVEPFVSEGADPLPGLITDILISMDDKFLYFSNWLHGDIRQYDITDPFHPKLVAQTWVGGKIGKEVIHQGKKLVAGPQMLQLSLDGKRLYVTDSLFSTWDDQFYPDLDKKGTVLLKLDIDTVKGGMVLDEKFGVDFGSIPHGPYRAHETRYPSGDCSSDIWLC